MPGTKTELVPTLLRKIFSLALRALGKRVEISVGKTRLLDTVGSQLWPAFRITWELFRSTSAGGNEGMLA